MAPLFTKRYRHIRRYKEIINVISKHGLGHLGDRWGLGHILNIRWKQEHEPEAVINTAQRIRMVLEELGPTFIKLGQILSTRPDLIPSQYIEELEKLQDSIPASDYDEIEATLTEELGQPAADIFESFSQEPIASASIGQVHEARLITGERVVVKIQRPNVDKTIDTDMEIMKDVTRVLELRTEWGKHYRIAGMAEEFARSIREELDYTREGYNADRIRDNLTKSSGIYIPKVYWDYSTRKVLVMAYAEGIKITDEKAIDEAGINRGKTAKALTDAVFKQILIDGFFHADPHPGNLLLKDNQIIFIDFGMVGRLDDWMKNKLGMLLLKIVRQDVRGAATALIELGDARRKVDVASLSRDIAYLFEKYYDRPLSQVKIGHGLREILQMAYVYKIRVPVELVMMIRCLILLEGTVEKIDPAVRIVEIAEPFGKRLVKDRFAPGKLAQEVMNYVQDLSQMSFQLPKHVDNLIQTLEEGELKVNLEHRSFAQFITKLNLVGNRISFSLVVASIIVGTSLIAQRSEHSILWRFPIAEAGFILASLLGLWLLISIIRSGRI